MKIRQLITFVVCVYISSVLGLAQSGGETGWTFAVSGDSRNCGDVIMPAIAQGVHRDGAAFYWHLGDFRAIYDFDQDYHMLHPKASISAYEQDAWLDFIRHQLTPFGNIPVYLGIGNHETIPPKTRAEAIQTFADWFDNSTIQSQRLADDPVNHTVQTYYHWIKLPVDFITLDNASDDMFDDAQVTWFEQELKRAAENKEVRSLVIGMHRALPDSLSSGHSMNDSAQQLASGRRVYRDLMRFKTTTGKNVYILASHSHFYMGNVYNTECRRLHPETILPGWIIGTAGAVRYELPKNLNGAVKPQNELYGYLLGRVHQNGEIQFEFRPIDKQLSVIPDSVRTEFTDQFVQGCLKENHTNYQVEGPPEPPNCTQ